MRMILAAAVAASTMMMTACGETQANSSGYIPTEEEVLAYEGASLFGELYASEADTFATWAEVIDGQRHMFAAGYRADGTVLVLAVHSDGTSSLQNLSEDEWQDYADVLGIPVGE